MSAFAGLDEGTSMNIGAATWGKAIGLAAALVAAYVTMAGASSLWDRDEPRYARASVEMLEGGDWLVPTFNSEPRLRKPPLIYWVMAGSIAAIGKGEVAARLPSAVGMAGAALLTFWIGVRLFNRRVGWWAMWMFGTSALAIYMGAAAMTDGVLMLFIVGAIAVFVDRATGRPRRWHWPAFAALMALGQLTKGPVGLAAPALTVLAAAWWGRGAITMGRNWGWKLAGAGAASVGGLLLWGVPANLATDGGLARIGVGEHVIHRIFNPMEGHGGSGALGYLAALPLYIPVIIGLFFPWTLLLPGGVRAMLGRRLGGPAARAILWGWILPTFLMMSLVATKLPHYILPIFPALAIVSAAALDRRLKMAGDRAAADARDAAAATGRGDTGAAALSAKDRDWLRGGVWFFGPVAGGVVAALGAAPWALGLGLDGWPMWATAAVVAGVAVVAIAWQLRERVGRAAALAAVATPLVMVGGAWAIMPGVEAKLKPSPALAEAARSVVGRQGPVYVAGSVEEDSLVFYLDLRHDAALRRLEDPRRIAAWASGAEPGALVITEPYLQRVEREVGELDVEVLERRSVVNYSSSGKRQVVMVVVNKG